MKSIALALAFALLAVLASAVPLNKRQDQAFSTTTQVVIDTIWTTTTLWVPSASAPAAYNNNNNNNDFLVASSQTPSSSAAPPPPPPPSPTPSTSVAPVMPTPDPPTPTTTWAPPPATTTAAPYVAPAAASPTPAPQSSDSGSSYGSTQGQYSGDITWYDVSVGAGSCGTQGSNSQNLVAIAAGVMNNPANPNLNPYCGKTINIYYGGNVHQGIVYDTCPTCTGGSLDLTQTLFNLVAPQGDGRVHGVTWSFA